MGETWSPHVLEGAKQAVRALVEFADNLVKDESVLTLVDRYYALRERRKELEYELSPLAVEKWVADGHCDWCPGSG